MKKWAQSGSHFSVRVRLISDEVLLIFLITGKKSLSHQQCADPLIVGENAPFRQSKSNGAKLPSLIMAGVTDSAVECRRTWLPCGKPTNKVGGKNGVNNEELRNWYLSLTDSNKQVFLALVSNHLTIHGRDFGLYLAGIEQSKAFDAFKGLNELQHQMSAHIAAIGLQRDRYTDDVLWKILHEKASAYGLTAHFGQSLAFAKSRNVWDK
jgi:hypothetical protein